MNKQNQQNCFQRSFRILLLTLACLFGCLTESDASHFRSANLSWTVGTNDTISFQVNMSWRWSAFGNPALGTIVNIGGLDYGDGFSGDINLTINSINSTGDWFSGAIVLKHKYAANGNYTAMFSSCCRISTLRDGNNDQSEFIKTVVTVGNGNNAPITLAPAIITLPLNVNSTYAIPGFDIDGNTYTFSITSTANSGLVTASPAGLTLSAAGVINWTPTIAGLYALSVTITDQHGATSNSDFVINVSNSTSNAPIFDYSVTPANNSVILASPGNPVSFSIKATDIDAGNTISLVAVGLPPSGPTFSPALPATGNPATTTFSWTPNAGNIGAHLISIVATDNTGAQTITGVVVNVTAGPGFNVPPTPVAGSGFCALTGVAFSQAIQAQNTSSGANVSITSMTGLPASATNSIALPTPMAPVADDTLNWTPLVSEWGTYTVTYTATDANNVSATHSFNFIINSSPSFTSALPPSAATAGVAYTYTLTGTDPNTPYGDTISFEEVGMPAWLSLGSTVNGTAVLSGTPPCGTSGTFTFDILLEDIHHHCGPHIEQTVTLNVTNSNATGSSSETACNSYTWNSNTYTATGAYTVTFTNANGCDSVHTLNLTIHYTTTSTTTVSQLGCYTWDATGTTYTVSGLYTTTLVNAVNCDSVTHLNLTITQGVYLSAKAILSGPYISAAGLMHDSLRVNHLIPFTEPYTSLPYGKTPVSEPSGETVQASVLNVSGNDAIVDWIFLELRSSMNSSTVLANKRALIQRDGDIVSTDGVSPVFFSTMPNGNYFVTVKHRNHLGVMSAGSIGLNGCSTTTIDFTSATPVYTNPMIVNAPRKVIGSVYTLWSADAASNKNVKYNGLSNDKDKILSVLGSSTPNNSVSPVYRMEDVNMDGKVRYNNTDNDRVPVLETVGVSTPNGVINQHTPN